MNSNYRFIALFLLFIALGLTSASAQDGKLSGKVWDSDKEKPLPLAIVSAYQKGTIIRGTVTDINGYYNLSMLSPGDYQLTVSYPGYPAQTTDDITIVSLKTTFINFDLAISKQGKPQDKNNIQHREVYTKNSKIETKDE